MTISVFLAVSTGGLIGFKAGESLCIISWEIKNNIPLYFGTGLSLVTASVGQILCNSELLSKALISASISCSAMVIMLPIVVQLFLKWWV